MKGGADKSGNELEQRAEQPLRKSAGVKGLPPKL